MLYIATGTPTYIITVKIVIHIFIAETVSWISAAGTSYCIIATETITSMIAKGSASCMVATETATCKIDWTNFYLQKRCQSEVLLVTVKKLSE